MLTKRSGVWSHLRDHHSRQRMERCGVVREKRQVGTAQGNLDVHFSRQGKHRKLAKNIKNMILLKNLTATQRKFWRFYNWKIFQYCSGIATVFWLFEASVELGGRALDSAMYPILIIDFCIPTNRRVRIEIPFWLFRNLLGTATSGI